MLDSECEVEILPCFLKNAFTFSDLDTSDLCKTNSCEKAYDLHRKKCFLFSPC